MKTGLRRQLTLGLILTGGFTGLGQSAAAASSETSSTLTIHVHYLAEVDHKTLAQAEKVATGIFRKVGVETRWIDPALSSENGQRKSTGEGALNLSHIQLNILPPLMAERFGLPNNVMGLAPGMERDRRAVYVFYDRVEALAERQMRARGDDDISTYRAQILGHVIVHEIGHVLLNLESHSDTGIMRGNWNLKQLQDAYYGYLVFTPTQAEAIRLEVARRSRKQETLEVN